MELKMNLSSAYFLTINILLILLSLFMAYLLAKKKEGPAKDRDLDLKYYEKGYLYKGPNFIYNTIIAMIVKVIGDGHVEIEKNFYKTKAGEEKISFNLKNLRAEGLDDGEKKLFDTLFSFGDGEISTRTLDKMRRREPDNYNKKFNDFIYYLEEEMVAKKLFTREKKTLKILLSFVVFSLLFFVGIVTVYNEKFFGIISIVLALVFYARLITTFSKMTELGNKKYRELEKVEEELLKGLGDEEEDFLLAIAFGLKAKNIRAIYENIIVKDPEIRDWQIFFEKDFYKNFKVALVGDHLLVRN
ncbi:MAG: DUF2207 domain-containing protein [Peptoniphilus grossensis]|uniref:DUF2207 family protein n=1 Tax=Peptoniphilus grossensis TaxID=1465756 RepID=UPI00290E462A|nr:DUF2207 domain-containing protein [Peptoniphilus grossensis]MDU7152061.1 DUF2207 domain-containing protein [Peptoniphilus grossensis]